MANNIPITARVNRGLFSQKKSPVQEPLLSVGVAGVYGNNETRTIPAPSKLMSSPFKQVSKSKSAGAKILEQQTAAAGSKGTTETITVPGGTKTTTKTVNKPYVGAAKDACSPEFIAKNGRGACDKYNALPADKKKAGNTTTIQQTTKEPDTNKTIDKPGEKVELRVYNEGDAMASFGRRQIDRAITHTARKTKRAEIDLAKAKAKAGQMGNDANGNPITDKNKFISKAKDAARLKQAETKAKGFGANAANAVLQSEQSKSYGGTILGTKLDKSKEETLDASRLTAANMPSAKAQTSGILGQITGSEAADKTNPTTSTSTSTPKVTKAPADVKPAAADVMEDDTDSPAEYKKPGFFEKRGPLKMKYFR